MTTTWTADDEQERMSPMTRAQAETDDHLQNVKSFYNEVERLTDDAAEWLLTETSAAHYRYEVDGEFSDIAASVKRYADSAWAAALARREMRIAALRTTGGKP